MRRQSEMITSKEQTEKIKREEMDRMRAILDEAACNSTAVWTKDGWKLIPRD